MSAACTRETACLMCDIERSVASFRFVFSSGTQAQLSYMADYQPKKIEEKSSQNSFSTVFVRSEDSQIIFGVGVVKMMNFTKELWMPD